MESFKCLLVTKREELGVSQTEIATAVGVSKQAVSAYERGQRVPVDRLPALYDALQLSDADRELANRLYLGDAATGSSAA